MRGGAVEAGGSVGSVGAIGEAEGAEVAEGEGVGFEGEGVGLFEGEGVRLFEGEGGVVDGAADASG